MNDLRNQRYTAFNNFFETSKELFEEFRYNDKKSKKFDDYYSLCVCPGGRNGGADKRIVEVFYGNRPFDIEEKIDKNWKLQRTLLKEHGVTIVFTLNDHGYVAVVLYPAATENMRPVETLIFMENYLHPETLSNKNKLKKYWKYFNSYMEVTSLDGLPTAKDKARVFYLRHFKNLVIKETFHNKKIYIVLYHLGKYIFTVWLSGFLIYLFTIFPQAKTQEEKITNFDRIATEGLDNQKYQIEQQDSIIQLLNKQYRKR